MLNGLIDAIANELSRAEAFDHNFFVAAQTHTTPLTTPAQLNEVRESLGANLVLATSGIPVADGLRVVLQVLDPANSAGRPLRTKEIHAPVDQQFSLPERAVRAAAELLNVSHYDPDDRRSRVGTDNPEALAAYQAAEAFMKKPNNTGLDAAIDKYKQAVEADRRYSLAYARLAIAYARLYELHRDPTSMVLARANADTAVALDPKSVESHIALSSVFWEADAYSDALREMGVALSLDPSNTRTLTYQAQLYAAQNRWPEAEQTFKRVLRLRPNHWLAYNELGNNYNAQGNYVDALAAFRAAAAAAPSRAMPLANVAISCFNLGSFSDALTAIDRSLTIAPLDGSHQIRSEILRAQGRYSEALKAALGGAKLNPGEGLSWLEVADSYSLLPHREREAADAYRRATEAQEKQLQTQPGDGPGWILLALYRVKSGIPASAPALIKKADSLGTADMASQLFKVRVLELLGRRDEALSVLTASMRKGVTIYQVKAIHDLDSLRTDSRFPSHTSPDVVLPQNSVEGRKIMKFIRPSLIAVTLILPSLSGCNRDRHTSTPTTVTVELSPEANLSQIHARDTIVFRWQQAPGGEYWVMFTGKTPCQGDGRLLRSQRDTPPQCVTKGKLDPNTDYIFQYGPGKPPVFPTDPVEQMRGGLICRPACD